MAKNAALDALFANKEPTLRAAYDKVVLSLAKVGSVQTEPKKTPIPLVRERHSAGAHPKKAWLDLTIRSDKPIKSARVRAQERISKTVGIRTSA